MPSPLGEGDDSVAYFRDDPPDVTERRAKSAELLFGGPPFYHKRFLRWMRI